jgi:hypothetical protein
MWPASRQLGHADTDITHYAFKCKLRAFSFVYRELKVKTLSSNLAVNMEKVDLLGAVIQVLSQNLRK